MKMRWVVSLMLVLAPVVCVRGAFANLQPEIDPKTGEVRIKANTCKPRLPPGQRVPVMPDSSMVYVPSGTSKVEIRKSAVLAAQREIEKAQALVWQQAKELTIRTATGIVRLPYFDQWAQDTGWGKSGVALEVWGLQRAQARGLTEAEFNRALTVWKLDRKAEAQRDILRVKQRFLDEHGVPYDNAVRAMRQRP